MGGVESEEMVEWKAALAVVNKLSKLKREMQTDKPTICPNQSDFPANVLHRGLAGILIFFWFE